MSNSFSPADFAQLAAVFGMVIFVLVLFRIAHDRLARRGGAHLGSASEFHVQVLVALYGLLLGFVTVALWQKQDAAEHNTVDEANQIRILSRTGMAIGGDNPAFTDSLIDYTQAVIYKEWPMMISGQQREMYIASPELDAVWQQIASAQPATPAQQGIYQEVVATYDELFQARQRRLLDSERSLPDLLRFTLLAGAVFIIIAILIMKNEDRRMSQRILSGVTAGYMVLLIYLVFVLEDPFLGSWRVTFEPYQKVLASLH